jgi:hypothetical protein
MDYPRLRYVEAFPVDKAPTQSFALRDPSGLAEDVIVLSGEALFFLQFFDGAHSLLDMRVEYMRQFGRMMDERKLQQIVEELDRRHFLEGDRFERHKAAVVDRMLAEPLRRAAHAGQSYPLEQGKLREQLDGFFLHASGAGKPGPANGAPRPIGVIAPHIDLRAGGPCYSHAYRVVLEAEPSDVFVILGTGHMGLRHLYSVLPKDFATPLGVVRHDGQFIQRLAANHSGELFSEPLSHRQEHTIEFQVIFLQHLFGGKHPFTIVPVLCSFAHQMRDEERFAHEKSLIGNFTKALRKTIAEDGRRVCVLASVDFSHIGPRYGDSRSPDEIFLSQVAAADHKLLAAIEGVDAEEFHRGVSRERDRFRVCGYAPIYTLLAATEAKYGKQLKYDRTTVDDQRSTVTFASAVLY